MQEPAEQKRPAPQVVPLATFAAVSVQTGPDVQLWLPTWHGFAGVQVAPAVQAVQVPAEQTSFVPQVVPSS